MSGSVERVLLVARVCSLLGYDYNTSASVARKRKNAKGRVSLLLEMHRISNRMTEVPSSKSVFFFGGEWKRGCGG